MLSPNQKHLEVDLYDINPEKVRDLIIDYLYNEKCDEIKMTRKMLHLGTSDSEIYKTVVQIVRLAFVEVGGNFDQPTVDSLERVMDILASKAYVWGTLIDLCRV